MQNSTLQRAGVHKEPITFDSLGVGNTKEGSQPPLEEQTWVTVKMLIHLLQQCMVHFQDKEDSKEMGKALNSFLAITFP